MAKAYEREKLKAEVETAQLALAGHEARSNLIAFTEFMSPDPNDEKNVLSTRYKAAMHQRVLAEALDSVVDGKCLRLIISMPPQHGKSELTSRKLPAYFMGRFPWKHLMLGTYSDDFAAQFGADVREIMESERFNAVFPECKLRVASKAKDYMITTAGGKLSFLGRGGAGTGKTADIFIIDDPVKDAKEADSSTVREDCWQWLTKVVYTRAHVLSAIVIVMTRWNEDDLVGRLTDPGNRHYDPDIASQWTVINIPAILTQEDRKLAKALRIDIGEQKEAALWPERFPLTHLHTARRMNPLGFSALYMGRPRPPDGTFFHHSHILGYGEKQLPKNMNYYGALDLALSAETYSDHTVILNWGLDENDVLWLLPDAYWERVSADASLDVMLGYARTYHWQTAFGERGIIDKAIGPFLQKRQMETETYFRMETFPASSSKAFRCMSIRGRMAQGKVRFPTFAPWWPRAESQMLAFTGSGKDKEDDFCDACGLIGLGLSSQFRAAKEDVPSNVIQIGSVAWVKYAHNEERRARIGMRSRKGF